MEGKQRQEPEHLYFSFFKTHNFDIPLKFQGAAASIFGWNLKSLINSNFPAKENLSKVINVSMVSLAWINQKRHTHWEG